MKPLTVLLAAGLAAACSKDADKQPGTGGAPPAGAVATGGKGMPTAADCDALGAKMVIQSMEEMPPDTGADERAVLQKLSQQAGLVIARLCKADGWSGEAVACGLTAKDTANECDSKLTAAQKTMMASEVQAVFQAYVPPAPAPVAADAGAGPAPAEAH